MESLIKSHRVERIMELLKFLSSSIMFLFSVIFLPNMIDAVNAVSAAEALKPFLLLMPTVFVLMLAIFPIYYLVGDA